MSIFKSHIVAMSAYEPPLEGRNPSSHLLLDFNERTLPVSEPIKKAMIDYIESGRMQMYPSYGDIVDRIAEYANVKNDQVMITNGSDQGIDLIFRSACTDGDEVIIPKPNFAMYGQCARIENLNILEPSYTIEEGFPLQDTLAMVSDKTRLIVVSNPHNPSGTLLSREGIAKLAEAAPNTVILVDECYFEYSRVTVADWVEKYPNLLVTRTFSKTWGVPSLRIGYIISAPQNIKALLNVRGPYDVNQLAVVAVKAALDNPSYTDDYVKEVVEESKALLESFLDKNNIVYWPSGGNFVWAFPENAEAMSRGLQEAGILVRPKSDNEGRLGLRITLGDKAQTLNLIEVLENLLGS